MDSRSKIIDDIHSLTDTENHRRHNDKLAWKTLQESSKELTGEDPGHSANRGSLAETIASELDTAVRKNLYSNDARLPQDALVELRTLLQQQLSDS